MGVLRRFENRMEDSLEGMADRMANAPISPVKIAKKAEKQMQREKMVGAGKQYAPTLFTVLVNPDDDDRLFGYYPTLAGETETYLAAKAESQGLVMDGQPLVRFIVDGALKRGKFDVIAEAVAAPIIEQLRQEEMQRYGIAAPSSQPAAQQYAQPYAQQAAQQAAWQAPQQAGYADAWGANAQAAAGHGSAAAGYAPDYDSDYADDYAADYAPDYAPYAQDYGFEDEQGAWQDEQQDAWQPAQPADGQDSWQAAQQDSWQAAQQPAWPDAQQDAQQLVAQQPAQQAAWQAPQQIPYSAGAAQPVPAPQTIPVPSAQPIQAAFAQQGAQPQALAYLIDQATQQAYAIRTNRAVVGRGTSCDVMLADLNASRNHAELRLEPQGFWSITDLGSMNGTFLNGQPITSVVLSDGDRITVGITSLIFRQA